MLKRTSLLQTASKRKLQVAIVGGGPSGCYVAHHLLKKHSENVHVDVYERLPVPYGLSRYGVAPDHPEVKNVEKTFTDMFESKKATFIGNVQIGKDVTIPQLREHYHAVVVATGAGNDLKLKLPGEEKVGVLSARQFVDYYNTVPDPIANPKICPFPLDAVEDVVLIGNGNVAIDCARVLAMPYKFWCSTDMNAQACKALYKSTVKTITIVARRGVEHSAFTTKEFRELTKADRDLVRVEDFDLQSMIGPNGVVGAKDRARRRMLELMHKYTISESENLVKNSPGVEKISEGDQSKGEGPSYFQKHSGRKIAFRYNLTPKQFIPHKRFSDQVGGVVFHRTAPPGAATAPTDNTTTPSDSTTSELQVQDDTNSTEFRVLKAELVLRSIGYKSDGLPDVPFDEVRCVIPNNQGRVIGEQGLYCSGWVKRGPKGVILQTMMDSQETAGSIWADLGEGQAAAAESSSDAEKSGKFSIIETMLKREILPVSMVAVKEIWKQEKERGVDLGKPAEKIPSCRTMVDIAIGGKIARDAKLKNRGFAEVRDNARMAEDILSDEGKLIVDPENPNSFLVTGLRSASQEEVLPSAAAKSNHTIPE